MNLSMLAMTSENDLGTFAVGIAGFLFFFMAILAILTIASIAINWKLFTKAGEEGWKSIIPFYNTYIMIKIALGESKVWPFFITMIAVPFVMIFTGEGALTTILSLVNLVVAIYVTFQFYSRYATSGMAIGAILLPFIFGLIIAFGDYQYTPIKDFATAKGDDHYE